MPGPNAAGYTLDLHANEADILRWEIHWGDGSGPRIVEGNARYATHFYADGDKNFTISVVAVKQTDSGPENIELTKELFVKNVAPTLIISGPAASQPNAVYQLGLSSYDPGDDTITHWTINWGDGTVETITGDPSLATHIYAAAGLYTISATATDEDGTWDANTLNIHVKVDAQTEWIKLVEDDRFVTDHRITFTVPEGDKALVLDTRNLQFDGESEGMINDAFEIALVDADGTPLVATIRTTRDGFLNITEGMDSLLAAGVLYDSGNGRIILDLSRIAAGTELLSGMGCRSGNIKCPTWKRHAIV